MSHTSQEKPILARDHVLAPASPALAAAEEALLATTGIPVERHEVVVSGTRLHYLTCGEGKPLLLLHDRGNAGALFAPVLAPLAERRRVIALDLPGWGLSDKPRFTGRTAHDALAVWVSGVLGLLDALGLEQVELLGHSMGGFTALGVALARPERVKRLVLVDTGGLSPTIQMDVQLYFALGPERLHRLLGRRFTRLVLRNGGGSQAAELDGPRFELLHGLLTQSEVIPSGAAAFHKWINFSGVHLTLTNRLRELTMPVLLMWGDRDAVTSYHDALMAARLLPDGHLVALARCGHSPFTERPGDFARVLLTWLDNIHIPARV